jgi:mono/diheme cytochrome c family protein
MMEMGPSVVQYGEVRNPIKFFCAKVPVIVLFGLATTGWGALTPEQLKALPPAASHPVDFKTEIKPIFEASCVRCHGRGRDKGGLQIDSRETLLKGGDSGPAVKPGHGAESYLLALVAGVDSDEVMPKKGKKLTTDQIGVIRAWIDQGLPWDAGIGFGPVEPLNLTPRLPKIPAGKHELNPVDRFMDAYFQEHRIHEARPVEDRVFARRVYLDTIGLLPPPRELEVFADSRKSNKRELLVAELLSRKEDYAENWLSFWNDLLRNDYKGTGYIDGGRRQITRWLYSALLTNMPYDQFVARLISPTKESSGFTEGIVWRGVVNASQTPPMQAAQNISQVFVGVNLKCASCHDSFINDWQLSDSYGLANIYSDGPLEIFECDKPTGKRAAARFIFPQLGELSPTTNKPARLQELARLVTCPKDGRLSRTIVNRLWARFMGRGLIEPVDDMQQTAWNQDLLDWLAEDLAAHHYDLKATIARILTSRAYQLPSVDPGEQQKEDYVFTGPEVRRMSAEEFRDALTALTGVGYSTADADVEMGENARRKFGPKKAAKWIWNDPAAAEKAKAGNIYLRKTVQVPELPNEATALVVCDNSFEFFVNGHKAGSGNDATKPILIDLKPWLQKGDNLMAIHAVNFLPDNSLPTPEKAVAGTENPAGLFVYARLCAASPAAETVMDFVSDSSWTVTDSETAGWETPGFNATGWQQANELGDIGIPPWRLSSNLIARQFAAQYAATHTGTVRAGLVASDPLMTAMGRPNREQVVTTRPTTATTLQALELTNGKTLAETLRRGAADLAGQSRTGGKLIEEIYEQAVGRKPTRAELKLAGELAGVKPRAADVEDFLWAVVMLPEFQFIY